MIRPLIWKSRFWLRWAVVFSVMAAILIGSIMLFHRHVEQYYQIHVDMRLFWQGYTAYLVGIIVIMVALFLFVLWDIRQFINQINNQLKEGLTDRKLGDTFDHFYKGKTFASVLENIAAFLTLLKTFTNMKAARISMETYTSKAMINNISEGILFINSEKMVSHINHMGEQMLRLIPGEILGQSVSRKISNAEFIAHLDNALDNDHKVVDEEISIKEGEGLSLTILPIKNKFGEIVRALVILNQKTKNEIK